MSMTPSEVAERIDMRERIAELEAERAAIQRQAEDSTEYVLATINREQKDRIVELETERAALLAILRGKANETG